MDENEGYRAVSGLAVVALLVSLFSLLAIVMSELIAVPIAAIVLSVLAWRRIQTRSDELTGRRLVLVGLAIPCLVLGVLAARIPLHSSLLYSHAHKHAETWLTLLAEERLYEAHQLTMELRQRQAEGTRLDAEYKPPSPSLTPPTEAELMSGPPLSAAFRQFFKYPPTAAIVEDLERGERPTYIGPCGNKVDPSDNSIHVCLLYRLSTGEEVRIIMQRAEIEELGQASWRLYDTEKVEPAR